MPSVALCADGSSRWEAGNAPPTPPPAQNLDFDFEKCCSVTLSGHNVYACLVCGKYFQVGAAPACCLPAVDHWPLLLLAAAAPNAGGSWWCCCCNLHLHLLVEQVPRPDSSTGLPGQALLPPAAAPRVPNRAARPLRVLFRRPSVQGRGPNTQAYTHALEAGHHMFMKASQQREGCLGWWCSAAGGAARHAAVV